MPLQTGRMRDLIARSADIAAWRGTAAGRALLDTATGTEGFAVEEPANRPFHLIVHVPRDAADQIDLIRRLVTAEKPAATTCDVAIAGQDAMAEAPQPQAPAAGEE